MYLQYLQEDTQVREERRHVRIMKTRFTLKCPIWGSSDDLISVILSDFRNLPLEPQMTFYNCFHRRSKLIFMWSAPLTWSMFALINKVSHAVPISLVGCCSKAPCHSPNLNILLTLFDKDSGDIKHKLQMFLLRPAGKVTGAIMSIFFQQSSWI